MRLALAFLAVSACVGPSFAADLPVRTAPPVFVPPPVVPIWAGFYFGMNAGGAWSDGASITHTAFPVADATLGVVPGVTEGLAALSSGRVPMRRAGAFAGGGQLGYNFVVSPAVVAGLEADIQGLASNRSSGSLNAANVVVGTTVTSGVAAASTIDYLGTVRGRLGYLVQPGLLVYGTGGFAYGGVRSSIAITQTGNNGFAGAGATTVSNTRVGWTAGAGAEWRFLPNWSVKVEYLRYDLGTSVFATSSLGTPASAFFAGTPYQTGLARVRTEGNLVRVGLNYSWNSTAAVPVVARY